MMPHLPFLLHRTAVRSPWRLSARFGSFAAAEKDGGDADRNFTAFRRVAVAAVAAGASGLCLWLLSSSSPITGSSLSFSDSDLVQSESICRNETMMDKKPKFLLPDSYRRRVFFKYEKRLRMLSSPEKIFEYFACTRNSEGELVMRPADLLRAVVPVFPPSESNNVREGNLRGENGPGEELFSKPSTFFMLFDTDNDGHISFPEYIFFVTLLSIPESSFSAAFKMFDLDNNGEIEKEEFMKVMALMRSYNRQGSSHRNGARAGLKVSSSIETGGLVEHFFGNDGKGSLHHDKFVKFLKDLHDEILQLEFNHYDFKSRGYISAKDFALSMVASADMNHIDKLLDRLGELDNNPSFGDVRITFEEFKAFAELRKKLKPLTVAIFSYGKVNGLLTKQDFIRAASHVCGITLSESMVDIIFSVFDSNSDGNLSSEEFLRALEQRETDIRQPSTTGFISLVYCWLRCGRNCCSSHMFN